MRADEAEATEAFLSQLTWVPVEESVSRRAAELARRFQAAYPGIEDVDYLVAATVLELAADLLTTNPKHFPMFPGLAPPY